MKLKVITIATLCGVLSLASGCASVGGNSIASALSTIGPKWTVEKYHDDFFETTFWCASSPMSRPNIYMGFPYNDLESDIVICRGKQSYSSHIGFFGGMLLRGGNLTRQGRVYELPAKFGDDKEILTVTEDVGGMDVLDITRNKWFINKAESADSIKILYDWYGEGPVVFSYSTKGLKDAVIKINEHFQPREK